MHNIGIVHRDIKPGNILVDRDYNKRPGRKYNIKISDFGHSFVKTAPSPITANVCCSINAHGTVGYCAPEMDLSGARNSPHSIEVDYFSLGCVMYELIKTDMREVSMSVAFIPLTYPFLVSL